MNLSEMVMQMQTIGYEPDDARARVCQDIVLKAVSESTLSRNVTIKGGVVMRSMTNNIRRATQDMDIDFIRYSLSDESIDLFVEKLNCLDGITIRRVGNIEELSQQDYNGKRVHVHIIDKHGNQIESKIDLGVHKHMEIEQEEYCFDIAFDSYRTSNIIAYVNAVFLGVFQWQTINVHNSVSVCHKILCERLVFCLGIICSNSSACTVAIDYQACWCAACGIIVGQNNKSVIFINFF